MLRRRTHCFSMLILSILLVLASASVIAQGDGEAPVTQRVRVRRHTPSNILRGLSFNSGGGADQLISICSVTSFQGSRGGMWALDPWDELAYRATVTLPPFSELSGISPISSFSSLFLWAFPVICSTTDLTLAYVVSPSGTASSPYIRAEQFAYSARLPLEAYAEPGVWQLVAESTQSFEINIVVPAPDRPTYVVEVIGDSTESYHARYLIGGFAPYERVVGFLFTSPEQQYQDYDGDFEISVNATGYALFELDSPDLVAILSQNGAAGVISHGSGFGLLSSDTQPGAIEGLRTVLYEGYWGSAGVGDAINQATSYDPANEVNCTNTPPSRLYGWTHGRVSLGDPNSIRANPESFTILGHIPGGEAFTIRGGPICGTGTHLRWWNVEYNGIVGWTAEGSGDTYWLEPYE